MKFGPLPIPRPFYEGEGEGTGGGQQQQNNGQQSLMDRGAPEADADKGQQKPWWETIDYGTDETAAATLRAEAQRYKTPTDVIKSLVETKKTLRTQPKDDPMPDVGDGKDEAKVTARKEWNKRHGVPDDPTGYKIAEDITKRLLETDKPLIDNFMAAAHKAGHPQAIVDFATKWYVDAMEAEAQRETENDKTDVRNAEDALRADWATNYRGNMDFAIRTARELLGDKYNGASIFDARLPNGTKLGSIPEFVKGMLTVGQAIYGDGSLVGDEAVKSSNARKAEIRQIMATDMNRYINEGLDKEYEAIIAAEQAKARP